MALLAAIAIPSSAQTRLRAESAASLVKEPNGLKIGALVAGRSYPVGKTSGTFVEATVEGWIPSSAALPTSRDGFDLSITAGGGVSLRADPKGAVVALLQEGTLLSKVGAKGNWVHVRRTGFVLRSALAAESAPPTTAPPPASPAPSTSAAVAKAGPTPAVPPDKPGAVPARDTARSKPDAPATETVSGQGTLRGGTTLAAVPDGAPLATLAAAADAQILDRNRDWVKVRVEGWVRSADLAAESAAGPKVTGAMVREQPDKYVGQTVTWRLQMLALQEADALRPEMPKGQPYVLARGPLPESGFVYLMVTKEQAAEFKRLAPLDELRVEAVIRSGRTKYLPTPVLELVKLAGK